MSLHGDELTLLQNWYFGLPWVVQALTPLIGFVGLAIVGVCVYRWRANLADLKHTIALHAQSYRDDRPWVKDPAFTDRYPSIAGPKGFKTLTPFAKKERLRQQEERERIVWDAMKESEPQPRVFRFGAGQDGRGAA